VVTVLLSDQFSAVCGGNTVPLLFLAREWRSPSIYDDKYLQHK